MSFKKISAAIIAAAVMGAGAPITGMLPVPLSAEVSAEEYKAGDEFYAEIDIKDGSLTGEIAEMNALCYICTVKDDGTISVGFSLIFPIANVLPAVFSEQTLTIPSEINGYTVSEISAIGNGLGFFETGCKKVIIPDSVTTIGEWAFEDCYFLEEVEFGSSSQLKEIGKGAFCDCRSLKSITIPASVETIHEAAFGNTDDEISGKVYLYKGSFEEYDKAEYNFTDKYSLTTVNFAENSKLTLIDQWAFQSQKALKSITLPDSTQKIGYGAFLNCTSLTEVTIPKNVDEIGSYAFMSIGGEIMNISEIDVDPDNKTYKSIDGIVFSKDGTTIIAYPAAKSGDYEIPSDVSKIKDGAFACCTKLTSVIIPEGVVDIPENAFLYCTALAEVKLPSALKTVGKWSFENCAFTSIDIPESVTSIDPHAFDSTPLKNINGVAGSYAETFAKENGYTFNGNSAEGPDNTTSTETEKPEDTDPAETESPDDTAPAETEKTDEDSVFTDYSDDRAADIQVIAKPNVIPKEAHFSVRLDEANSSAERIAYNCYFTYNGAEYEPTETVTVRIPIPIGMRDIADTLKVYHLQNGKYVKMNARVEDGFLVFDTDHFSTYIVTAEELANDDSSDTEAETSKPDNSDSENNPNTGAAAAVTAVGATALAGTAVLVTRKFRK